MIHWDSRVDVGTLLSLGTVLVALLVGLWRLVRRAERLVDTVDALSHQLAALASSLRRHVERTTGRMDLVELRVTALEEELAAWVQPGSRWKRPAPQRRGGRRRH